MDVQTGPEGASDLPKVTQQRLIQCQAHAFFTALEEAIHFSPRRPRQAPVPSAWERAWAGHGAKPGSIYEKEEGKRG